VKKIVLLMLSILISSHVLADDFVILRQRLSNCYIGIDQQGNSVSGKIHYVETPIGEDYITLGQNGEAAKYLEVSFHIPAKGQIFITHIFDNGKIVNTEILNRTINYSYYGLLERYISGTLVAEFNSQTIMAIQSQGNQFFFDIFQNNNYLFLPDQYAGRWRAGLGKFSVRSVSCLD